MAPAGRRGAIPIYLEVGKKRVFASAADWPGWCRQGKTEQAAIDALSASGPRYAIVPKSAGIPFTPSDEFDVVERLPGDATTDFGAPGAIAEREARPLTGKKLDQVSALVAAGWTVFDGVAAKAPAELRKGPRGGGRDRDEIFDHILGAESAYASKLGLKLKQPASVDHVAVRAFRESILAGIRSAAGTQTKWPPRYAARRIAWHAVDHAWEIEDRSER